MELTDSLKTFFVETAHSLKGSVRRIFMARTVRELGPGGQRRAERELGWDRATIRKGMHELTKGIICVDAFSARGRKRAEERLPRLLEDIRDIVDSQSQADPRFKTERLYTRLSASEVRRQLLDRKGYTDDELPTERTIVTKLRLLGYYPQRVKKSQPRKKIPETDAIFDQLNKVNAAADADPTTLRLSMDAKATVKVGPFSRDGTNRVEVKASDHDFASDATVTPVGIFLPACDELYLYGITSKVTADCLADCLEDWWEDAKGRFPQVKTWVLNLDNGPECHSRRTQFLKRMVEFAQASQLSVRLAYTPPYHSKYNAVERCWGVLETHWNGDLLETIETVLRFAQSMTWKGKHPIVKLVTTVYEKGVKLTKKAMADLETQVERLAGLEKWFVDISFPLHASGAV